MTRYQLVKSLAFILMINLSGQVLLFSQEPAGSTEESPKTEKQDPETITATRDDLRKIIQVDGIFRAQKVHELILTPEKWKSLKVVKSLPHGTYVEQGEPVLWLETDGLVKTIENLQHDLEVSELSLTLAEEELRFLRESTAMKLSASQIAAERSAEDLDYFRTIQEPQSRKLSKLSLENAQFSLEYAQEELNQLKKMYEADDLTEETEEIILKRAERDVRQSQNMLEQMELRHEQTISTKLPRSLKDLESSNESAQLNHSKNQITLPVSLRKKKLEVDKLKKDYEKKKEDLVKHQEDLALLTVTTPASGIIYYGRQDNGNWPDISAREKQLVPGGTIAPHQVIMSIVSPDDLDVSITLSEAQLEGLQTESAARVNPVMLPNLSMIAKLGSVSLIPKGKNQYRASILLADQSLPPQIRPGMQAKVSILVYQQSKALMLPEGVIHRDWFSDDNHSYIWINNTDGVPLKKQVQVGVKNDGKVEILSGVTEGDQVLKTPPK